MTKKSYQAIAPLNIFYEEPHPDRWIPYDRYPRQAFRELLYVTGIRRRRPSGQSMVYKNLKKGLDLAGIPYRDNDFEYISQHPSELACIVGKYHALNHYDWKNPILFGASAFAHPIDCPNLFQKYPVRRFLVPGFWKKRMCDPYYGEKNVTVWPVGIDVEEWCPEQPSKDKPDRVLLYDKVRWYHDRYEQVVINPIRDHLKKQGIEIETLQYGHYFPADLKAALRRCQAAIFLCEHETQGIAYQQMLSSGVPIFAWDRGGYWQDPNYFPERIRYEPVTSVPYWDERCGMKFATAEEFASDFNAFWAQVRSNAFSPRAYIVENLTLEKCARWYADIAEAVVSELGTTTI